MIVSILKTINNKINHIKYKILLAQFGKKSYIVSPLQIDGYKNIKIGNNCMINYKSWLAALPLTGFDSCELFIDNGVIIGHYAHIFATKCIHICGNVLIADHVYISDNIHGYEKVNVPIKDQPIVQKNEVRIGENSWLGENVCVIGARIGRNCIVGANSVVTHDIPDYCVAVGSPAKVIKKFNFTTQKWEKV